MHMLAEMLAIPLTSKQVVIDRNHLFTFGRTETETKSEAPKPKQIAKQKCQKSKIAYENAILSAY